MKNKLETYFAILKFVKKSIRSGTWKQQHTYIQTHTHKIILKYLQNLQIGNEDDCMKSPEERRMLFYPFTMSRSNTHTLLPLSSQESDWKELSDWTSELLPLLLPEKHVTSSSKSTFPEHKDQDVNQSQLNLQ